jgi:hypothetical protein
MITERRKRLEGNKNKKEEDEKLMFILLEMALTETQNPSLFSLL